MVEFTSVRPVHSRPTFAEIDLAAVESNYRALRDLAAPSLVMGVMKANAYGHGLIACADRLVKAGCPMLGVALVEEGIQLREAGITVPILVFGGFSADQVPQYLNHDLDLTASSIFKLEQIDEVAARLKKRARVHLKIDTGMERIGVHHYSAESFLEASLKTQRCEIVGLYSHLASADGEDSVATKRQIDRFLACAEFFPKRGAPMPLRHIANSAGTIRFPEARLDLVRPGLSLYGVYPRPDLESKIRLLPAMTLKSQIVYFKVTKAGSAVGYGGSWTAGRDTRIVTIPIGYGDGYSRALSNRGEVLIRGKRYPIRGTVCMDQIMVDIGAGEGFNGDEVVLIGAQGNERISADDVAARMGSISYEVLTLLNPRVPRVYRE